MPYRSLETDHGPYGTWKESQAVSVFVKLGSSPFRWGVRWGDHGVFPDAAYRTPEEALRRLRTEREAMEPHPRIHVVDRKTGKCFCPPPDVVDEVIDGRCRICKAGPEERCDAGLHS